VEIPLPYGFVEGPLFATDLARIEPSPSGMEALLCALQDVLLEGDASKVSHALAGSDIRYAHSSRDFPKLEWPPFYLTFRFERADLIELRRIVTEADVRAGFYLE
jgi:hypothetical protein